MDQNRVKRPDGKTARIHQNIWGNWYGYVGSKRVEMFFGSHVTMEIEAREWLAEQGRAFTVVGSHGEISVGVDGSVLLTDSVEYREIAKFDVVEKLSGEVDILTLGYWTKSGQYEPAIGGAS